MRTAFKVVGIATIVIGCVAGLCMLTQPLAALLAIGGSILSGALWLAVADLLERVEYLEQQLGVHRLDDNASHSGLPQKTCPNCGEKYDFDYPKCPHCGAENPKVGD